MMTWLRRCFVLLSLVTSTVTCSVIAPAPPGPEGTSTGNAMGQGMVQKGPFLPGGRLRATLLDEHGAAVGTTIEATVETLGAYKLTLPLYETGRAVLLEGEGLYFDERVGGPSSVSVRLRSVVPVWQGNRTIHLNVLTEIAATRVQRLLEQGRDAAQAQLLAKLEVLHAMGLGDAVPVDAPLEALTLDDQQEANEALLAASAVILETAAGIQNGPSDQNVGHLLTALTQELADGHLESAVLAEQLRAGGERVDAKAFAAHLSEHYASTNPNLSVTDFTHAVGAMAPTTEPPPPIDEAWLAAASSSTGFAEVDAPQSNAAAASGAASSAHVDGEGPADTATDGETENQAETEAANGTEAENENGTATTNTAEAGPETEASGANGTKAPTTGTPTPEAGPKAGTVPEPETGEGEREGEGEQEEATERPPHPNKGPPPAVDECAASTHTCHPMATCTDTPTSYTCTCPPYARGDGFYCVHPAIFGAGAFVEERQTLQLWGRNQGGRWGNGLPHLSPSPMGSEGQPQTPVDTALIGQIDHHESNAWVTAASQVSMVCGIRNDPAQTLWCWGAGQLGFEPGHGTLLRPAKPVVTAGVSGSQWVHVAVGYLHACALRDDSTAWCWGHNSGVLGNNVELSNDHDPFLPTPVAVDASALPPGGWQVLSLKYRTTCGIHNNGDMYCWGESTDGALGTAMEEPAVVPTLVDTQAHGISGTRWTRVAAGVEHTCGIRDDGTLWCWGADPSVCTSGRSPDDCVLPSQIETTAPLVGKRWLEVTVNNNGTCAMRNDGARTIYCWGDPSIFGDGTARTPAGMFRTQPSTPVTSSHVSGSAWVGLSSSMSHVCSFRNDDTLWCWGNDHWGQLGNDVGVRTFVLSATPTQVQF